MEIVLSIAGSDPSAGAGVQQDLKTITAIGCYGMTVITALTTQNTIGVQGVMPVPKDVVSSQLESLFDDIKIDAIKIGQVPDADVASVIVEAIRNKAQGIPVVYDPVMISTSGHKLMASETVSVVKEQLFPLCTLITPNIPEAEFLLGRSLHNINDIMDAGKELCERYGTNVLIKGGHAVGADMTDTLFMKDGKSISFTSPKVDSTNLHGTGCTLSSSIASYLAKGFVLSDAVRLAKDYVHRAIVAGKDIKIGHGNGPLGIPLEKVRG